MLSAFGPELFSQFCVMNAMKYLWRSNHHKDGKDRNIDKAIWYLTQSRKVSVGDSTLRGASPLSCDGPHD